MTRVVFVSAGCTAVTIFVLLSIEIMVKRASLPCFQDCCERGAVSKSV